MSLIDGPLTVSQRRRIIAAIRDLIRLAYAAASATDDPGKYRARRAVREARRQLLEELTLYAAWSGKHAADAARVEAAERCLDLRSRFPLDKQPAFRDGWVGGLVTAAREIVGGSVSASRDRIDRSSRRDRRR